MSDSSDDETSVSSQQSKWIRISDRPEWSDVKPVQQDEGPIPVVRIAYSEKFAEVYDYYRAIVCSGEISTRALELTKEALELNSANYSVWHHRRTLLKALDSDLVEELNYCRAVIEEHPKNYQVWQHRRILVDWLQDPGNELRLTEIILSQDAKNYHAWQHRQWVVKTFGLYENELKFLERLLEDDIRNNSAWNHRFFVVSHQMSPGVEQSEVKFCGEILERELQFCIRAIDKVKANESSWNYLNGLLTYCDESEKSEFANKIMSFCRRLYDQENVRTTFLLATLVDLESQLALNSGTSKEGDIKDKSNHTENAIKLCEALANEVDPIRKEYWNYMAQSIEVKVKD